MFLCLVPVGQPLDALGGDIGKRLCDAVADAILAAFARIRSVKVTVHKPHAPIAAIFEDVGVVLTRSRQPPNG